MKRLSLRFSLCNLIFGDALRRAMAFGIIQLEDILKYNIYDSRLSGYWYRNLLIVFDDLSSIIYEIDHNSLEFDEEGSIVNKAKRRFKICNLLYFGSLSSELVSAIRLLYVLTSYLNATGRMYNESCSDAIRCIIHIFDKIMY